jgi:hypothetical protein
LTTSMPRNPSALAWALVIGHEARVSDEDRREVMSMSEMNYHGRMMNIGVEGIKGTLKNDADARGIRIAYKLGHRDARHVAAEIAAEADARIAALEAQLERAREALRQYANRENWGYLDESGCFKGAGSYTDHCVLGPEAAEAAIAGEASGEERR